MSVTDQLEVAASGTPLGATTKKKKSILQFEITKKRVPPKELMQFSRQFAAFLRAGIPILDALDAMQEEMSSKLLREIVLDVIDRLRGGATFADAMAEHADAFPAYYLGILRSAELTGRLDEALVQLAGYVERDLEAKRKITSALAYPAVIVVVAAFVVVILVAFVLPKFRAFFASFGADLPLTTRVLLGTAGFIGDRLLFIVLFLMTAAVLVFAGVRTEPGRRWRDATLLRLPVVGDLVNHIVLERFCRILAAMLHAGVPMLEALTVTADATSNRSYQRGLGHARQATIQGDGLAGPLIATGLFPAAARQMFRVGENTGTLDQQLANSAEYFARELDYKIKRFTSLFEPAVLIFVGLIVGFVAVALVSAMFGIYGAARTV